MNKNRWKYFRWTPRGALITFMYVAFVPGILTYAFSSTDVSHTWTPKPGGSLLIQIIGQIQHEREAEGRHNQRVVDFGHYMAFYGNRYDIGRSNLLALDSRIYWQSRPLTQTQEKAGSICEHVGIDVHKAEAIPMHTSYYLSRFSGSIFLHLHVK